MNIVKCLLIVVSYAAITLSPAFAEGSETLVKKDDLLGSWQHIGISKTAEGASERLTKAVIHWVFMPDGKGEYQQKVASIKMNASRPFSWELKGNTILLAGGKTKYTIVKFAGDEMIWKNELLGDFFHVKRSDVTK